MNPRGASYLFAGEAAPLVTLAPMTEGQERFTLTPPPPVRALAIAAVTALVAAGLMVASRVFDLGSVVLVVGLVGLGLAVALAVAALVLATRARTDLVLGPDAVTVTAEVVRERTDEGLQELGIRFGELSPEAGVKIETYLRSAAEWLEAGAAAAAERDRALR